MKPSRICKHTLISTGICVCALSIGLAFGCANDPSHVGNHPRKDRTPLEKRLGMAEAQIKAISPAGVSSVERTKLPPLMDGGPGIGDELSWARVHANTILPRD